MRVVDRLTRVRASRFAWGALLVASGIALVVSIGSEWGPILEIVLGFAVLVFAQLTALSIRRFQPTIDPGAVAQPTRGELGGDAAQLREELAEARSQLRQAEEAFRFREAQRSKSGEPALRAEVAELREALAAAEASSDRARAEAAGVKAAESNRFEELEDRLLEEQLRRVNVERAAQDATSAAELAERERFKELEETRAELDALRAQLQAALLEARAAAGEAERARQELVEERARRLAGDDPSEREKEPSVPARENRPAKRRPARRTTKATATKTQPSDPESSIAEREAEAPPETQRAEAEGPPGTQSAEAEEVIPSEEGAPDDPAA